MEKEKRFLLMGKFMRESIKMEKNVGMAFITIKVARDMKENG